MTFFEASAGRARPTALSQLYIVTNFGQICKSFWQIFLPFFHFCRVVRFRLCFLKIIVKNTTKRTSVYVNAATNVMDSAYQEERNYLSKDYYTFYDFSYENRQNYIDSVFNYDNKEYEKYSRYDIANPEPYHSFDTIVTDKLLDFPLVDLNNDTTTLREQNSWVLLYFWRYEDSHIEQLEKYVQEKDSLGYRILENEDVRIMAIEPSSNNMEYIERVADKYDCEDIIYSAKEIYNAIDVLYHKYYLISPDKKVVYKNWNIEDYEEIIDKLKVEN